MGSSVGSADRAVRLNNIGTAGLLSFNYGYFFDPASDITETWVLETIFSNRNSVFTLEHWLYGTRDVRKHAFPILRFRDIFLNYNSDTKVTFRMSGIWASFNSASLVQEGFIDAYVDGVGADFSQTALSFTVSSSSGIITGTADGKWRPDFAYSNGEFFENMTDRLYISSATNSRLNISNKTGSSIGTSVSTTFNLITGETYRMFFKTGITTDPNWTVKVEYVEGYCFIDQPFSGQLGGQPVFCLLYTSPSPRD